jgi:hypothetical protein
MTEYRSEQNLKGLDFIPIIGYVRYCRRNMQDSDEEEFHPVNDSVGFREAVLRRYNQVCYIMPVGFAGGYFLVKGLLNLIR